MKILKFLAAALIALFATSSLAACSSEPTVDVSAYAAVIDVRTPEEWSEGRLEGAIRMGIADADFMEQLATLDPTQDYYIYCRSGNRAGQAIDIMRQAGFTGELVNGGSVANASGQTGLSVLID